MSLIKSCMPRAAKFLVTSALLAITTSAFAASTWNFGTNTGSCSALSASAGTCKSTTQAINVKVTAFSSTTASGAFAAATLNGYSGGFGVTAAGEATSSPQHSTDNSGSIDLLFLDFGSNAVDLDSVTIGWKGNSAGTENGTGADADISVFRYTGATAPSLTGSSPLSITNKTQNTSNGWNLVGNYADLVTNTSKAVNSTNLTSSWWLISAYNSGYGTGSVDQASSGLTNGNDYFKVLSIAGNVSPKTEKVPEPGSLALLGAAFMGFVATRRRKSKAV